MPKLHVVIPIYNERETLAPCVRRVVDVALPHGWDLSLHLIDDHSADDCFQLVRELAGQLQADGRDVSLCRQEMNRGKGAALQRGFDDVLASGSEEKDLVIIQDADLEYDPADYPMLMEPLVLGQADVALGTRWGDHNPLRGLKRRIHAWGNAVLTSLSNRMTGYRLHDMECCYKLMPVGVLRKIRPMLTEQRFGIEPQMVAAFARIGATVVERPVRYDPRGLSAGKKIRLVDGLRALLVIAREGIRRRSSSG